MFQRICLLTTIILAGSVAASAGAATPMPGGFDGGAIGGAVSSDAGSLEGLGVELWGAGALLRTTVTDAEGSYGFSDLEPGTYQVRVESADGRFATLTVEIAPGTTTSANLVVPVTESIPLEPTQAGCVGESHPDGPICSQKGAPCRDAVSGLRGACHTVVQSPYPGAPPYRHCACIVGIGRD